MYEDLTKDKHYKEDLKLSLLHYKELAESISEIYFALDSNLRYTYWNKTSEKLLGISSKNTIGKSLYDIFPEIKNTEIDEAYKDALKTKKPKQVQTSFKIKGTEYFFDINVYPSETGLVVFIKDITEKRQIEVRLKEEKERFRILFDKNPVGVVLIGLDYRFLEGNNKFARMLGYTANELKKLTFSDITYTEDIPIGIENTKKLLEGSKSTFSLQKRYVKKNKEIIWCNLSVNLIRNKEGKPLYFISAIEDITKIKLADWALQESEVNLRRAQSLAKVGSWKWILATKTVQWSEELCQINGHDPHLPVPSFAEMSSFYTPESWERLNEVVAKALNNGESYELDLDLVRTDGSIVKTIARGEVHYDASGKLEYLNGTVQDITEHKQAVQALKESEEKYRTLIDKSNDAVTILQDGIFVFANHKTYELTGKQEGELEGKPFIDFVWPEDREIVVSNHRKRMAGETLPDNYDFRIIGADGNPIWLFVSVAEIQYKGRPASLNMATNITERKHAEAEILSLSLHDYLTGLYNRRFFEEELKRLNTKRQLPLSFIMGDLNGLKLINDAFGHSEGDRLLKDTAEILKKVCRSDDILARWGGDEFAILLPKTSTADTEQIVARIKSKCKKTNNHKIPLSLSLGASTKEAATQDIQTVVIDAESNMYKNKLAQKESIASSIVLALERTIYEKSLETKEHTDRIKELALRLGRSINLSSNLLDELSLLASLHDLGKIAIPETILLKEGKLTKQEWEVIKRHPEIGFNIASSSQQIAHIAKAILSCHENFDGSGYPMGISGDSIPIISRIILITDSYDVMTNGRLYKKAVSKDDAIKEIKRCADSQFDPVLVDKFIGIVTEEEKTSSINKEKMLIKQ